MSRPRLVVIACPSLQPDLEMLAAGADASVAFHHLERGLHEHSGEPLRRALQSAIDQTTECDAVVIAYGLCNRSVVGLKAGTIPVIIPRAHDCIGILLGSSARYLDEIERRPGTYFESAGWLKAARDERQPEFTFGPNSNVTRTRLAERYGDDAADYLLEQFGGFTRHYQRLAYIAMPVDAAQGWEGEARGIAARHNWKYERLEGDPGWLNRLLNGEWSEAEFLMLQPGERVTLTADERLIAAEAA
jgi:Protein of unknown function (DUF1638)